MRARVSSTRVVGRAGELAELEDALQEATGRCPVVVLLGGESGIGKTRLLAEFERRLGERDGAEHTLMLRGEAIEQADGELPYAPLLAALRPLVRDRAPALEALSRGSRAQLAALLPGLQDGEPEAGRDDPSAQLRLFEALLELLDLLSDEQPLVLALEDMHWADRSTRAFVAFVTRTLRQERVMVLLTYRTDELHRRHALRPLLAELERLERARRIQLRALERDELAEVLRDILEAEPSEQLLERLFARSEGNPLYTEELLAAGLDGRGAAPQSLRDAFLLRIERLSDDAQQAARAIAVGRALEESTIAEVSSIDPERLKPALREAVAEQILLTDEDDRLCFRHALLREVLYDDLLPGERCDLHLLLARSLEDEMRDRQDVRLAGQIARHYAAAGDQPAALRASVQAALAAREVRAYGETAELAERALELWPRVPEAAETIPLDHVELTVLAANALAVIDSRGRAETLLEAALAELDPHAEPIRYSSILARLARLQWSLNRGVEGVQSAQRALSMLPADEASSERALLLAWLARTRHLRGRFREALSDGEEALAAAVAAGEPTAEIEVLNTLGMAQIALGQANEGVARLRRAIELARAHEDPDSLATAYSNLADMLGLAGRTREALDTAREGLASTPKSMTRAHDWVTLTVAELAFNAGEWGMARAHITPSSGRVAGILLIMRLLLVAEFDLEMGSADQAARCCEELEPLIQSSSEPQWIGAYGAVAGELHRRRGELIEARAAVEGALDRLELCTEDVMRIARVSATGVRVEADLAQRGRDLRGKAQERDALARARIHVQRLRAAAQEGGPVERAWLAVGQAELARARGRSDHALWQKAARAWDEIERPYRAAQARWRAAQAAVEAGDRAAASEVASRALDTAQRLGARWLTDELTALAERGRLELDRESAAPEPATPQTDPFGLTERERQVLALIAEGATNRQIGASLYMAEKTASVHVSRILAKLGVSSRTQAAALAHRQHLA